MTDLSQIVRWNAGFMRGLAESVLNRAKTIRSSLVPYNATPGAPVTAAAAGTKSKTTSGKGKKRTSTGAKSSTKRASTKTTKGKRTAKKQ